MNVDQTRPREVTGAVVELMAAYLAAEREETVHLPSAGLDAFVPQVARADDAQASS